MKRAFDIFASATALIVFSPLLLVIAVAIWLETGRPIIFSQQRLGRGFRQFAIWKFRTMRTSNDGPRLTVTGDVRITRVGRFLRLSKLDELPQFVNVLRGDMSIVGPRPEVPEYAMLYEERYRKILALRPGITDVASMVFRNEEQILSRSSDPMQTYVQTILPAKLDLAESYLKSHSMGIDLRIIFQTLLAVIYPRRAPALRPDL